MNKHHAAAKKFEEEIAKDEADRDIAKMLALLLDLEKMTYQRIECLSEVLAEHLCHVHGICAPGEKPKLDVDYA